MSTEEPAWKAELEAQIRKFDAFGMPFIVPILEPFIRAAEQRGREAGLRDMAAGIRTRFLPSLAAEDRWVDGWLSAADYVDPDVDKT